MEEARNLYGISNFFVMHTTHRKDVTTYGILE
jgi:hypothetical protein